MNYKVLDLYKDDGSVVPLEQGSFYLILINDVESCFYLYYQQGFMVLAYVVDSYRWVVERGLEGKKEVTNFMDILSDKEAVIAKIAELLPKRGSLYKEPANA